MNYTFTQADWFAESLPSTTLYRGVKGGLLTLGHLRTAEALDLGFLGGLETSPMDWGILVTISQNKWRKSFKKVIKPTLFWLRKRDRNTPRNEEELKACFDWWKKQNYYPTRMLLDKNEIEANERAKAMARNRASTSIERLALSVARIDGWQALCGTSCVWDIPLITATHLLVANAELEGSYHIPYDLIREAENNG